MDYTLAEIINHKNNILNLSNNLINTADVNQEITLNEELIKQAQFLLKLLNIKKNFLFGQNFQNNNMNNIFNPMQNNQMNMFNNANNNQFQQMMEQNIINKQQELQRKEIRLIFRDGGSSKLVSCFTDEKISEVINKYNNMTEFKRTINNCKFIFDARPLNPNETVEESLIIYNYSNIFVLDSTGVRGG